MKKKLTIKENETSPNSLRPMVVQRNAGEVDLSTSTPLKTTDRLRLSLKSKIALLSLKRFIQSSGHLGHRPLKLSLSRVCYPAASTLLIGERGTGAIINPSVTLQQTAKGLFLGASLLRQKGKILIIDTRGEISPIGSLIEKHNSKIPSFLSFSGNRWVGGSLTNWSSISEMIGRSAQIKTKFQGFLEKTRILLPRYEKMKQAYPGFLHSIKSGAEMRLIRHPDLLFLINPNENRHVIEEARTLKIPVIALVDSNTDLSDITIPIPVNYNSQFWSNAIVNILIDLATSLSKKRVFSCKQKSIPVKTIRKPSLNGI